MAADHPAGYIRSQIHVFGNNFIVLIFLILAALPCSLYAQQTGENIIEELTELVAESYGPDQHLINGAEYFNLHIRSAGHKFLDEDKFYKGRIVIDKKVYDDVSLKYDIFNQKVLLLISPPGGGHKQIILNNVRIDEFEINGRIFHKYISPLTRTFFYQAIGNDEMACLYHFKKQEVPRPGENNTLSKFTETQKKSYLYWQSELHEFKGNRSFVGIFSDHQPQIKAFIRQNKFRVKKLNDSQMHQLIQYCNSITKTPKEDYENSAIDHTVFFHAIHSGCQGPLISGDYRDLSFDEFAGEVEDQVPLKFIYRKEWTSDIRISASGENMELSKILSDHFSKNDLYYFSNGKRIFITRDNPLVTVLPDYDGTDEAAGRSDDSLETRTLTEAERLYIEGRRKSTINTIYVGSSANHINDQGAVINGHIKDSETGESLVGATIFVQELARGFITDINGNFTMSIPPGSYIFRFNCLGMKELLYKMEIRSSGELDIEMSSRLYPIDEITVKSSEFNNVRGLEMGFTQISIKNIKEIPVLLGEKDVLKVVHMLPGVQNAGEGSAGINVRGSAADQNMFFLNKIPVYNTSHFFGFFSAFNPDIIRDFSFYKSNLPAKYGGRLASVIDISSRQGNSKNFTARGGISPITAKIAVEGPIIKDRSSYVLSARSTYSDWILKRMEDAELQNSNAQFYDLAAGISTKLNDQNLIKVFGYYSKDQFLLAATEEFQYSNAGVSMDWWHQVSSILSANTSFAVSQYQFDHENNSLPLEAYQHDYQINHYELKSDFTLIPGYRHKVTFGGNAILYDIDRGEILPLGEGSSRKPVSLGTESGIEGGIYVSDQVQVSDRLSIYAGLRYSFYAYMGPQTVYEYAPDNPAGHEFIDDTLYFSDGEIVSFYSGPEIRASAIYLTGSNNSVKLSYNKTRQYLYMLSNTIALSPTDQWKLSDYHVRPQSADQVSIGFYQDFNRKFLNFSAELYYKKAKDIVEYKDGANFIFSPQIETEVLQGKQKAYGIELMMKKNAGKLSGWLSFTYARSLIKVDGDNYWEQINQGNWYPANYDIPVSLNGVMNLRVNRRLSFSSNIVYHTGRPITYPVTMFHRGDNRYISYSGRNEYRIPNYFRLDLSVNLEGNLKSKKFWHSYWMLNIYNLTGRKNAYSVFFKNEEGQINGYKMSIFSRPIVTLSWNFKLGNYASD